MSELQQNTNQSAPLSSKDSSAKINALVAYGFMILGLVTGVFWIIGAVWAMIKKAEAKGSLFEDHYSNIIKTFWWGIGFYIIGIILVFVVVGYIVLLAVWIWSIYRIVKGIARITSDKAYSS